MKLLRNSENKITKDKNGANVPRDYRNGINPL